jgi:hypothetical protein
VTRTELKHHFRRRPLRNVSAEVERFCKATPTSAAAVVKKVAFLFCFFVIAVVKKVLGAGTHCCQSITNKRFLLLLWLANKRKAIQRTDELRLEFYKKF